MINKNLNDMKTRILLPIMAVSILAGCKEDEPTWEESVRDSFNYEITINVEQDAQKTVYIWPNGCCPIEKKGNFYFSGNAADFVLSNAKKSDGQINWKWETEWGTICHLSSKGGEIEIHTFESYAGFIMDKNTNYFSAKLSE